MCPWTDTITIIALITFPQRIYVIRIHAWARDHRKGLRINNTVVVIKLMMDDGFYFVTAIERERLNAFSVSIPNGREWQRRKVLWRSARLYVSGLFKGGRGSKRLTEVEGNPTTSIFFRLEILSETNFTTMYFFFFLQTQVTFSPVKDQ